MVRRLALILCMAGGLSACAIPSGNSERGGGDWRGEGGHTAAVVEVLDDQVAVWNRGDIEAFMQGYWESPELVFTSGGHVQRGWRTTLERYRATYGSSRESMGTLSFHHLEVHSLADDVAWALGRWALRGREDMGGVFTLVLRRIDGDWRIIHDHTSVTPPD
ncbi:MAG: nuclear transport factor 2 family protein [Gemmatimonadota bacterium]